MVHANPIKLGIMVDNLGLSDLSFDIHVQVNKALYDGLFSDVIVFYSDAIKNFMPPGFCIMHVSEAMCFDGPIIATSINTALQLINIPGPNKKFFYINNLDWIHDRFVPNYAELAKVYQANNLEWICRSEHHADAVKNCFNTHINLIMPDFNLRKFHEYFGKLCNRTI